MSERERERERDELARERVGGRRGGEATQRVQNFDGKTRQIFILI